MSGDMQVEAPARVRVLPLVGGVVALGVGLLGVFLPLLPTTPFLLLASVLFLRASPTLHARLLAHPRIGPHLERAQSARLSARAKVAVFLLACAMMLPIAWWTDSHALRGALGAALVVKAVFLARMRST